jgi:hypothetical protein
MMIKYINYIVAAIATIVALMPFKKDAMVKNIILILIAVVSLSVSVAISIKDDRKKEYLRKTAYSLINKSVNDAIKPYKHLILHRQYWEEGKLPTASAYSFLKEVDHVPDEKLKENIEFFKTVNTLSRVPFWLLIDSSQPGLEYDTYIHYFTNSAENVRENLNKTIESYRFLLDKELLEAVEDFMKDPLLGRMELLEADLKINPNAKFLPLMADIYLKPDINAPHLSVDNMYLDFFEKYLHLKKQVNAN